MDKFTIQLLRIGTAVSVAALEWGDADISDNSQIVALEKIEAELRKTIRAMKKEG